MTKEDNIELLRQDMLEDSRHQELMKTDVDYALEYYEDEVVYAINALNEVCRKLCTHGWEYSICELIKEY